VLPHAREDEHDVDLRVLVHGFGAGQVGGQPEPRGGQRALLGLGIVDRRDAHPVLAGQALDQAHVRRPEDASAAEDAEADGHRAVA
jgi:hypothetical protein